MHQYLSVALFALTTTVTPGPNILMVLYSGLNHGIRRSIPHYLGICIGLPIMITVVGLFLGPLFMHYPLVHYVLKGTSLLYLVCLAFKIAFSHPHKLRDHAPIGFMQAAMFQWINPKVWMMALGAVATFTHVGGDIHYQILMIGLIFLFVTFPSVGIWLVGSASLKRFLTSTFHLRVFNICMGLLLLVSIAPMAYGFWQEVMPLLPLDFPA
ncbi:Cysteine/O-acetylserine efflux protein [BD1-7 clade bacterium]|uniref:Cysteine/O-acetylserine efflux protein n=1 Tax=BD1-7 clade bacterium TaxID=2029982 RepID=A0A5S9QSG3_9GAMM|nr:Cysteine/O-acetylserine efflux protein [BD1-7 clade bacterium]CAA0121684.1 Cysteine/O-acetylserine efflux protein [BD1-7 clade bacterium]